ncbi:putative quinol monooxygenase [Paractinoplanes toevensis]|uniref:Antibiotic biosynthesis monooxygenase n=1 Tax=Paractinoplanes toevensis TaxID=571911 RepID=A0A919W8G4_9ACTN|nr:antibiotic biosynthesis monooxygenase family protein [Actinoplanes toevensis]GIM93726.1 antibiotic biosynthesis monooxygenase [Actinoplanes toevensis]
MLIVAGTGHVDPDRRDALLESLAPALRQARTAPGCLDYVVAADPVEADRVNIYERWESPADLEAHLSGRPQDAPPMPGVRSVEVMRYDISGFGPLPG